MTQAQKVLKHLKRLGSISQAEAYRDYNITRLAARIKDLKDAGHDIDAVMKTHAITKSRYARYELKDAT